MSAQNRRRVHTPVRLQMEATECGAASLGIVLAHHGRWVGLEELREVCGVSRDGASAAALLRAARHYGLEAHGYRKEPEGLRALEPPFIVFWEFGHFLVVEGWRRGTWHLNDPAVGLRSVSEEQFSAAFTGVVITAVPGSSFTPGGRRPSLVSSLAERQRSVRSALVLLIVTGLALMVPSLAVPALARVFVDVHLVGGSQRWTEAVVIGMLAAAGVQALGSSLQGLAANAATVVLTATLSTGLVRRLLDLPARFHDQRSPHDLVNRVALPEGVAAILAGPLAQSLLGALVALCSLGLLAYYSLLLFGVVAGSALALAAVMWWSQARSRALALRQVRDSIDYQIAIFSAVSMAETVKANGLEQEIFDYVAAPTERMLGVWARQDVVGVSVAALSPFLVTLSSIGVLAVGAWAVMAGNLSLGTLVAAQLLARTALSPVATIVSFGGQVQQLAGDLARIDDIAAAPIAAAPIAAAQPPSPVPAPRADARLAASWTPLRGHLELRGVTFGYNPTAPPLLARFDLVVAPGERVAVVGRSGSGKSTLTKVVTGQYVPWEGAVLLDGRARAECAPGVLADGLAVVSQDVEVFAASVRDNVTLWDDTIDDAAVTAALRDACVYEELAARPGGLDWMLGEGGRGLSGGQRQRLAIARALVRDPRIVVLDEATSALDPLTEVRIDAALRRRGCTCLIVAHRLSTVRDADQIVVLDQGVAVERGTHDVLLSQQGAYAELVGA